MRRNRTGARAGTWRERRVRRRENRRPCPPGPYSLLPWLLMGLGAFSNLFQGRAPNPWIGGLGLLVFNSLYISVVFRGFDKRKRESPVSYVLLAVMAVVTFGLAIGYGGTWLLFVPLLSLACGVILRHRQLLLSLLGLAAVASLVAVWRGDNASDPWTIGYGTFISGAVTAAILTLSETVMELRATRQELARTAVEKERLRFSRDLHDLLGHTLSVIVVKSEAARRLAPRDMDAALAQVADIESVGRQALTEIREAVTGYREGSLATELDRARSALTAAGIESVVRRSGPPLTPQAEALLGWVVRETVTNVVRHSAATACSFLVDGTAERVRLTVTDDGRGPAGPPVRARRRRHRPEGPHRTSRRGGGLAHRGSRDGRRFRGRRGAAGGHGGRRRKSRLTPYAGPVNEMPRDHRLHTVRVLLAEDQCMMRGALALLLGLEPDIEVVAQVGAGDEIVDAALLSRPDVALLDIELPGRSGLDAAADLREEVPDCRVLILTTFGRPGYLRRAMEAGAAGFLVKDGPVEELAAAIRRVLTGETVIDPVLAAAALSAGPSPLTARERDALNASVDGATVSDIAAKLHLSESTVRNYLSSAIGKTGTRNRMEAVRAARQQGWL